MSKFSTVLGVLAPLFIGAGAHADGFSATAICKAAYPAGLSEDRSSLYATLIRANLEVPQANLFINLKGLAAYLRQPLPLDVLMAPITEAETLAVAEAMNRAHAAFGVNVSTKLPPNSPGAVSLEYMSYFPSIQSERIYQNLTRILNAIRPEAMNGLAVGGRWNSEMMESASLRTHVSEILNADANGQLVAEMKEIGLRFAKVLDSPNIKEATKAYRYFIRDQKAKGLEGQALMNELQAAFDALKNQLYKSLKAEFGNGERDLRITDAILVMMLYP